MSSFATLPTPAEVVSSTRDYSVGFFESFLPILYWILALFIAVAVVIGIKNAIIAGVNKISEKKEEKPW